MPAGAIAHATQASAVMSGSNETAWFTVSNISNTLFNGSNVLAIELHQNGANSSDINFNFNLIGDVTAPPPVVQILAGEVWNYYDNSQKPPNDAQGDVWEENNFNDSSWSSDSSPLGYGDMDGSLGDTVLYSQFVNTVVGGLGEGAWVTQSVSNLLVTGSNTVAVEVQQANAGSSDISFNFNKLSQPFFS